MLIAPTEPDAKPVTVRHDWTCAIGSRASDYEERCDWGVFCSAPNKRGRPVTTLRRLPAYAEGNRTHRFIDANQNGQLDSGDTDITEYTWDHRNRLVKVEHRASYAAAADEVIEFCCENRVFSRMLFQ